MYIKILICVIFFTFSLYFSCSDTPDFKSAKTDSSNDPSENGSSPGKNSGGDQTSGKNGNGGNSSVTGTDSNGNNGLSGNSAATPEEIAAAMAKAGFPNCFEDGYCFAETELIANKAECVKDSKGVCKGKGAGLEWFPANKEKGGSEIPVYQNKTFKEIFNLQQGLSTVDVLWVVDNSNSMANEQEKVAENFEEFLNQLLKRHTDFNMGIITTDEDGKGNFINGLFTKDTRDIKSKFMTAVKVGTKGSSYEQGLNTAEMALRKAIINESPNSGFLRENAALFIIILSDDDDLTEGTNAHGATGNRDKQINFILNKIKPTPDLVKINGIIADGSPNCRLSNWATGVQVKTIHDIERIGYLYIDAVKRTNGVLGNLCEESSSYKQLLKTMGASASGLSTTFKLKYTPKPSSVEVKINNKTLRENEGYLFNRVSNSIVLTGSSLEEVNAKVEVSYIY